MKNFIPKKINSIELIAKSDDNELLKLSKFFIEKLNDSVETYAKEIKKNIEEGTKLNKDIEKSYSYFVPEILNKQSPFTIIDAPWGSGKTYFIEHFAKNFISGKIDKKNFKNIIVLDVWQYANAKNIPDELILKICKVLISKNKNNEITKYLCKFASFLIFNVAENFIEKKLGIELNLNEIKLSKKDVISKLNTEIESTIIVLDNIERLGKYSWEILKALQKLSKINKFVFIMPMNLSYLKDNVQQTIKTEYTIEKFIDLPYFNFKQDYLGFLKKHFKNDEHIKWTY